MGQPHAYNDYTPSLHEVLELLDFIAFHCAPKHPKSPEDILKLLDASKAQVEFYLEDARIRRERSKTKT